MSEVKRYQADEAYPGQYSARCDLVPASAYDAAQSQLAALREELDGYRAANMVLRDELKTERLRADAAVGDANEAEQRLADAERRNAERDQLIADVLKAFQLNAEGRGSCINPGITFIQPWAERVAALNPKPEAASHD